MTDPSVQLWREAIDEATTLVDKVLTGLGPPPGTAESTSARLRRVVEERDALRTELATTRQALDMSRAEVDAAVSIAAASNVAVARIKAEKALLCDRLGDSPVFVARDDYGLNCLRCDQPIVRGQAVQPQPGTTKGSFIHACCPKPPSKEK